MTPAIEQRRRVRTVAIRHYAQLASIHESVARDYDEVGFPVMAAKERLAAWLCWAAAKSEAKA